MLLHKPSKENTRAVMLCALYSLILLFFLSPDSYIRDLSCRCDSAWFFTCGKAWMNGMTPYVDFADSKGPLLWLTYGIGYLLNHHSYVGVFWISVIFYTATLFLAYRLSRLFLDAKASAVATAFIPFFLFLYIYHFEVRAEDFCNTFMMLVLYALCRVLRDWRVLSGKTYFLCAVAMGVSCAACAMIKWNIGVMILMFMAVALLYSIRAGHGWWALGGMAAGFIVVVAPFVIYLLCCDAFNDFIREYFSATASTVGVSENTLSPISLIRHSLVGLKKFFLLLFFGLLLFLWKKKKAYWWLLPCFILMWVAVRGFGSWAYYAMIFAPFAIFPIIKIVEVLFDKLRLFARLTPVLCLFAAIVSIAINVISVNKKFEPSKIWRQSYYRANYVMAQIEHPKVLCYSHDYGIGAPAGVIPACKYWALQNGATEEMISEREQALKNGSPDFVIVLVKYEDSEFYDETERVENAGYVLYETTLGEYRPSICRVYGRPGLKLPPDDFYVSDWDVWLKRNIFGI